MNKKQLIDAGLIVENQSLKSFNSWRVGGESAYFSTPCTEVELKSVLSWALTHKISVEVIGGGTNILVSDDGYQGLIICTKKLKGIISEVEECGRYTLQAYAGTPKAKIMRGFLKRKLSPALFLSGLPGNLDGGIVMNAGVSEKVEPREFCEITDWVDVLTWDEAAKDLLQSIQVKRFLKSELDWVYRKSLGWQPGVIIKAQLSWPLNPVVNLRQTLESAVLNRKSKQPLELPSCGSTFKNPKGAHAGALIDQSGLKGHQIGDVQVSTKHANFIVSIGPNAKAEDIYSLIRHVQKTVFKKFEVKLEHEVRFIGNWSSFMAK